MVRKGAAGWAWLSRRGAGGHLPVDSVLRSERGWVLVGGEGVCPLRRIALGQSRTRDLRASCRLEPQGQPEVHNTALLSHCHPKYISPASGTCGRPGLSFSLCQGLNTTALKTGECAIYSSVSTVTYESPATSRVPDLQASPK